MDYYYRNKTKKKEIKESGPTTLTLKLLLTNSQCGGLLGLGAERKRKIERDTSVSLIVSNLFIEYFIEP
jgi:hypothetical protein